MEKSIMLDYKIKPILFEELNSEFTLMRCYVLALGKNRNFSYFSKEAVDKAISGLYNIPVVAHLQRKDDGGWYVGSHDRQIVIDDKGITVNDLTIPFGVVPESASPEYVEVTEEDGSKVTYLALSLILWTGRYPDILEAKSTADDNIYFNQSMEILPTKYTPLAEDKNYMNITEFIFSALTLLGRDLENPEYNSEPCFPSARVEPFSLGETFKKEFSLMIDELKKLSLDVKNQETFKETEDKQLNEKLEILAKYNLVPEDLDFSIDDMDIVELEAKVKDFQKPKTDFSATFNQKRDAIRNVLDSLYVRNEDGDIIESTSYWLMDFDDTYAYVEKNYWNAKGDFEETHGRFSYTFDETDLKATLTSDLEEMFLYWLTAEEKQSLEAERSKFSDLTTDFENYKLNHSTENAEVEILKTFKLEKEKESRDADVAELFAKFEKLNGNEEFEALKKKESELDIDVLTEKCFAIYGKTQANFSFEKKKTEIVNIKVDTTFESTPDDVYGEIIKKYSKKD